MKIINNKDRPECFWCKGESKKRIVGKDEDGLFICLDCSTIPREIRFNLMMMAKKLPAIIDKHFPELLDKDLK